MLASPREHLVNFKKSLHQFGMNNVYDLAIKVVKELEKFPPTNSPRKVTAGGTTIDITGTVFDTRWIDTVGAQMAPVGSVSFDTCLMMAKEVPVFISQFAGVIALFSNSVMKSGGPISGVDISDKGFVAADVLAYADRLYSSYNANLSSLLAVTAEIKPYKDLGYKFAPATIGTTPRDDDVYTLAEWWENIDFRAFLYCLNSLKTSFVTQMAELVTAYSSSSRKQQVEMFNALLTQLPDIFTAACSTFKDLAYRIITTTKIPVAT